ncbi:MAG TPA: carboxypeptidase regulatory-like domain-containing protein, partial [Cyclobacteriaceae bacterium]|nr:carboxypeptidase regulatory-like domain-containing protein [Cyclobacteriaceae bacterium]
MRRILLLTFGLLLVSTANLLAQGMTTSFLAGTVKDKNGPVPGANIVAVHEPTGTSYGTVSTADGKFSIANMRVGGPYKVTISFVGMVTQSYSDINLKLGETYIINHVLKEEGTQLDEVVVTSTADKALNAERSGAVTNISSQTILTMPTISRSVNDMIRMTPQATSIGTPGAIGGGNYRQNNFTIDGSDFNNSFGIGNNLPGAGNPMSLDALEQISINLTPYDIRQSGFIGSAMNAVTRSGSNTFTGSAYTFQRTQGGQGDQVANENKVTTQRLDIKTYGFRLGGPIIKNKLFFFVNYEGTDEIRPGQTFFASTPSTPYGSSPNITKPDVATLDSYSQYLQSTYGYATGGYQGYDFKTTNVKAVAKIDWNINTNHRLSVRYSQVENKAPSFVSTSRSPLTAYGATQGRNVNTALTYENSNYFQENNLYSVAAELNSSLAGGKITNMLRATYTNQNEPRSSNSSFFPFVDILDGTGSATATSPGGNVYTSFGYEPFTYGNLRQVKTYSFIDNLSWTSGKHAFTVGAQYDLTTTKNGFQRFGASYYTFNSWNDFTSGASPRDFAITYSLLPGYEQAFPTVKTSQASLYGQDEFTVNDRLKLSVGLRMDMPFFNETKEIQTHPLVAALTFENGRKIDTGVLPDSK